MKHLFIICTVPDNFSETEVNEEIAKLPTDTFNYHTWMFANKTEVSL